MFRLRNRIGGLLLMWCALSSVAAAANDPAPVRFGITGVVLTGSGSSLGPWQDYLAGALERPVTFVQRRSYHEVMQLLLDGQLEFAWLCGYPYVRQREHLRLVAVPVYQGRPLYRSYLIVPIGDTHIDDPADLADRVFAFSDPDSNSGYLVPQFEWHRRGLRPAQLLRRGFFTWSHEDVVRAVSDGVAGAGAVDGYVWDTLAKVRPELTADTRVAWRSPPFGFPPIATHQRLDPALAQRMQTALTTMSASAQGRRALEALNLDGFTPAEPALFDDIATMARHVGDNVP